MQPLFTFGVRPIAVIAIEGASVVAFGALGASQRLVSASRGPHLFSFVQLGLELFAQLGLKLFAQLGLELFAQLVLELFAQRVLELFTQQRVLELLTQQRVLEPFAQRVPELLFLSTPVLFFELQVSLAPIFLVLVSFSFAQVAIIIIAIVIVEAIFIEPQASVSSAAPQVFFAQRWRLLSLRFLQTKRGPGVLLFLQLLGPQLILFGLG